MNRVTWEQRLEQLAAFGKKHGHWNVPEKWPPNRRLANWVHGHRHKKRKGSLSAERIRRLNEVGFRWSVCKSESEAVPEASPETVDETSANTAEQSPYNIRNRLYVQYDGRRQMPDALAK